VSPTYFSKFAVLIAISAKQVETVAKALFSRWLCRHGMPVEIVETIIAI
jgi:hypothetical protein